MKEPILVILAAGMGSRYGKLKQMDGVGVCDETIMDFSMYDAKKAGFKRIVFIIKKDFEEEFKEKIGNKAAENFEVAYAFQDINDIPGSYDIPDERKKPWGTSHALYAARNVIDAPFAVINSDDYYGKEAYKLLYDFLTDENHTETNYCLIGYILKNTTTKHGTVNRGICSLDAGGNLVRIDETIDIADKDGKYYTVVENESEKQDFTGDEIVSMNMWGFYPSVIKEIENELPSRLDAIFASNPVKGEYYIPEVVTAMIEAGKADVEIITSPDKWYGVTYQDDKPKIVAALKELTDGGAYPAPLW